MEYTFQTVFVRFRSRWHRILFAPFARCLLPWAQGRMGLLRWFLEPDTVKELEETYADIVISAGAALAPLNAWIGKECCAKSIVAMKPSFPFLKYPFDLVVVGKHDRAPLPSSAVSLLIAPSSGLQETYRKLGQREKAPGFERVRLAVFLGGTTRRYPMELDSIKRLVEILEQGAPRWGDYVLTTSRRTPECIESFLATSQSQLKHCQWLVLGSKGSSPETVPAMMALAEAVIVTEDSISMISEALLCGKKVLVLELAPAHLPSKHQRFKNLLVQEKACRVVSLDSLATQLEGLNMWQMEWDPAKEQERLLEHLQRTL